MPTPFPRHSNRLNSEFSHAAHYTITPAAYFVCQQEPAAFAAYEAQFPAKENLRLPGQIFEN